MDDATTLEIDPGNVGQLRDWDGDHGTYWAELADTYDAAIARYQPALLAAIDARRGDRVLDIGCGSGQVAIDVVSGTPGSTAVAVDLSRAQLAVGKARAGDLPVEFLQADAQVHDFGAASYDVVASRTGTMFFSGPDAAFANLARATKPGGRLAMLVWREIEVNEWLREFFGAIGRVRPMPPPPPDAPGPLSMSDPGRVAALLAGAGWSEVRSTPYDEMMWFGEDADGATDFIAGQLAWLFEALDEEGRGRAHANLHDVMADHEGTDGVLLGSGAWIVTASKAGSTSTGEG